MVCAPIVKIGYEKSCRKKIKKNPINKIKNMYMKLIDVYCPQKILTRFKLKKNIKYSQILITRR